MTHNHDCINKSILAIRNAAESDINICSKNDWQKINKAFTIFSEALLIHMDNEDSICYNQAEVNIHSNTVFYRLISDHMQIRELVNECHSCLNLHDRNQFSTVFEQLDRLIGEHCIREEELMRKNGKNFEASTTQVISLLRNLHLSE